MQSTWQRSANERPETAGQVESGSERAEAGRVCSPPCNGLQRRRSLKFARRRTQTRVIDSNIFKLVLVSSNAQGGVPIFDWANVEYNNLKMARRAQALPTLNKRPHRALNLFIRRTKGFVVGPGAVVAGVAGFGCGCVG